ncbi:dihydrolipoyl dehydrogenase [Parvularcula sp. ZS-1/3]|uniref:Dihydrolipoyl dehydrogenase n=1 Tax=Parvularcula mediterranea TaxID=2732508 RepID=A0A7Y3W683_9PROT|nr:dihydrolipoyl dehydrogenase [Parvularcula mediterranea]NNU17585.1 dihydrolipoyl dehydrogenase [Parvularcula mediterranea]
MPDVSCKIAVIGAGTAGLAAFRSARELTDDVLLIESGPLGTTCAREGCMPSKALIASAKVAATARGGESFGVKTSVKVDGPAVMKRVRRLRDHFVDGVIEGYRAIPEAQRLRGRAKFLAPGILDVGGRRVEAERIVIATGSEAVIPGDIAEATGGRFMTVGDIFELHGLPERLLILGSGVIGCEIADSMASLGVEVSCLSKGGDISFLSDPLVKSAAETILKGHFRLLPDAEFELLGWEGDVFSVKLAEGDGPQTEGFDAVLVATGRKPSLNDLNLEKAGLELDDQGTPQFDELTRLCRGSEDKPVFIAGDADAETMVLPRANWTGEAAGRNAANWPSVGKADAPPTMGICFTEPSMAQVGKRFSEVEDRDDLLIGCADFSDQGRAICEGRNEGILRIYGSAKDQKILGAEMIGPDAEHHAHILALMLRQEITISEAQEMPAYHPVTEEGLRTALRNLSD